MKKKTPLSTKNKFQGSIKGLLLPFITLILILGCNFPLPVDQNQLVIFDNLNEFATNPVEIIIQLELPRSLKESDVIFLEILDEVSGLANNSQKFLLRKLSDKRYFTIVSVPAGSVIKYRYGKISDSIRPEITPAGDAVLYRMYFADEPASFVDTLFAWQGEVYQVNTGWLAGELLDTVTNQPIPDILINAGGQSTFSDANGHFLLPGLTQGVHHVVFYALDGKYQTFQQGAEIEAGKRTSARITLHKMPEVDVTFNITPPNYAFGAPIYIAGNVIQAGNTFVDLPGQMSVKPKRLPLLTENGDGTFSVSLRLYAGTDLRYKFTLGDGYWNSEQIASGGLRTRQLIVPSTDITIEHTIEGWHTPGTKPITFEVNIPPSLIPDEQIFIQFEHNGILQWTEPLPLWMLEDDRLLYIFFSPLAVDQPIKYQFCRNENCSDARDVGSQSFIREVHPSESSIVVNLTLDGWENWHPLEKGLSVKEAFIPQKPANFNRMIELSKDMDSSWLYFLPQSLDMIDQIGVDTLIFTPKWATEPNSPFFHPEIGSTPFHFELTEMINSAHSLEIETALFPQLLDYYSIADWWSSNELTEVWWQYFFASYKDYILNYARIAQETNTSYLIIGGKALLPAFSGGILPDGELSTVPTNSDELWSELITAIRESYAGNLVWATNTHLFTDPLPTFIDRFDQIYISVDSPLALGDHPSYELIQTGFTGIVDNHIYEVFRTTQKPIYLAIAYPSVEHAASGCAMLNEACNNDGLFSNQETKTYIVDLQEQSMVYNAILPIIASRPWITGISTRGYHPIVTIFDGSSSIAGKPAYDVVQYWFTNMKP